MLLILLLGCGQSSDSKKGTNPVTSDNTNIKTIFDITGFVRQKTTKKGLENITLKIGNNLVVTNSEGKYELKNMPKGLYNLTIQHQDWDNYYNLVNVVDKDIISDDILLTWKYPVILNSSYEIIYYSGTVLKQVKFTTKVSDEGGDNTIANVRAEFTTYQSSLPSIAKLSYNQTTNNWIGNTDINYSDNIKDFKIIAIDIDGNSSNK